MKHTKKNAPTMAATTAGASTKRSLTAEVNGLYSESNLLHRMAHDQIFYTLKSQSLPRLRDEVMLELMRIQQAANALVRDYLNTLRLGDEDAVTVCQCVTEGLGQITNNALRLTAAVAERQGEIKGQAVQHVLIDTMPEYPATEYPSGISVQDAADAITDDLSSRGEESQIITTIIDGDFHVGVM